MTSRIRQGIVEIVCTDFVIGWVEEKPEIGPTYVYATVGSRIIGVARADIRRDDLDLLISQNAIVARAFIIVFDRPITTEDLQQVEVCRVGDHGPISRDARICVEPSRKRQIFVLGSPRSGTSELAATLAQQLELPWTGEGHAAPLFAEAATVLQGALASPHSILKFMAQQRYRDIAIQALRRTYYFMHSSSSFLDKTPGIAMIDAATFLAECFPDAGFIYMRRNGISNVLSRITRFGGSFNEHCTDWAAAMDLWAGVRAGLPHYLEVDQEEMWKNPHEVAEKLAVYLDEPGAVEKLSTHLATGRRERTGAGIGRSTLASTGWSEAQIRLFCSICGHSMNREGYDM